MLQQRLLISMLGIKKQDSSAAPQRAAGTGGSPAQQVHFTTAFSWHLILGCSRLIKAQ